MQNGGLRKYGVATTITFELYEADGVDLNSTATPATGDIKISKDEGAFANTGSVFATETNGVWSVALTATEMQAARISLSVVDQTATKVWLDTTIAVETYGDVDAQHQFDLDLPTTQGVQVGAAEAGTLSSTQMSTDLTEVTVDHWVDGLLIWTSGVLKGSRVTITASSAAGLLTYSTTPTAESPSAADTFVIV